MAEIYYKSGFKYQLVDDYQVKISIKPKVEINTIYITLTTDGFLTIRKGYAWDGPSGPSFDTKNFMRGSLVHDALYQLLRMELLSSDKRDAADEELKKICLEDGMSSFRVWYVIESLHVCGGPAADPNNKKKVCTAP